MSDDEHPYRGSGKPNDLSAFAHHKIRFEVHQIQRLRKLALNDPLLSALISAFENNPLVPMADWILTVIEEQSKSRAELTRLLTEWCKRSAVPLTFTAPRPPFDGDGKE